MECDPDMRLLERLQTAETADDVHGAQQAALGEFDQRGAAVIQHSTATLACREGCSLCCSLRVDVYAHEVFLIAQHVRNTLTAEAYKALLERLQSHAEAVLPLTPFEHATRNLPCPLLQDGRCSVYAVRPMACRRQHSLRLSACEYSYAHPADLEAPSAHHPVLFAELTTAMQQNAAAYRTLALDTYVYELGTALEEALTDESSWTGWLQHMEAFARASLTPTS